MLQNIDKKSLLYLGIVILVFVLAIVLIWYFSKSLEIESLLPTQEKIKKEEKTEEILERLTPTSTKAPTEKEREELEKILKQSTPKKPASMTEKEQKELEELLKKLTP